MLQQTGQTGGCVHAEGARHMTFHCLRMGSHETLKYKVKGKTEGEEVKHSRLTEGRIRILHVTGMDTPVTSVLRI